MATNKSWLAFNRPNLGIGNLWIYRGEEYWPDNITGDRRKRISQIYVTKIQRILESIIGLRSGVAILSEIGRRNKFVAIAPRIHGKTTKLRSGKTTNPFFGAEAMPEDTLDARILGGSSVYIKFLPEAFENTWSQIPGFTTDAVLVHELSHAIRQTAGLKSNDNVLDSVIDWRFVPTSQWKVHIPWEFKNFEEFFAVVLANIYLSEKGVKRLRAAYRGKRETASLTEQEQKEFAATHKPLFDVIAKEHVALTKDLRIINCPFNPIRDHHVRQRAEALKRFYASTSI